MQTTEQSSRGPLCKQPLLTHTLAGPYLNELWHRGPTPPTQIWCITTSQQASLSAVFACKQPGSHQFSTESKKSAWEIACQ